MLPCSQTQKYKLLHHRWHPNPLWFGHLFYTGFIATRQKSPTQPHAWLFKAHFNPNHAAPAPFSKYSTCWLMWAAPHVHPTLALRANIRSRSLINLLEDHQYLSFTIQTLMYCIGKYILVKHTYMCLCVYIYIWVYIHMHTWVCEYVYISI